MSRPPFAALVAVGALLLGSTAGLAAPEPETGFDCRQLADRPDPVTAADWLARSLQAGHCYVFQARAVRISGSGVRTLVLSHDIRDGFVHEVARYLDGPLVVHERRGRIMRGASVADGISDNPALPEVVSRIERHYRLTLDGEERIAGRRSVKLAVEPLDTLRYGHRLWLDAETVLPLKQALIDVDGNILETFQMTELVEPTLYEQEVAYEPRQTPPSGPWRPGWLPPGYTPEPLSVSRSTPHVSLDHRLYSDGLSSFSLFAEPLQEGEQALLPGVHRLGVSHAAVRHLQWGKRILQVVVMGELPPSVLRQVAAQLEYRPADAAVEEPEP